MQYSLRNICTTCSEREFFYNASVIAPNRASICCCRTKQFCSSSIVGYQPLLCKLLLQVPFVDARVSVPPPLCCPEPYADDDQFPCLFTFCFLTILYNDTCMCKCCSDMATVIHSSRPSPLTALTTNFVRTSHASPGVLFENQYPSMKYELTENPKSRSSFHLIPHLFSPPDTPVFLYSVER
jgi:hypothetical protein